MLLSVEKTVMDGPTKMIECQVISPSSSLKLKITSFDDGKTGKLKQI